MMFFTLFFACSGGKSDVETDCSDGIDDDNDGLIDCADWDCSSACIGEYEEDDDDDDDTGEKEEDKEDDTGEDTETPLVVECSDDSYENTITGTYGNNEYTFNAVMWDGLDGEVVLYMVSDDSGDANKPCENTAQGTLATASLSVRTFGLESFPTDISFEEPQGADENYAVLVDDANDVKDAAKNGSITLDFFDWNEGLEGKAYTLSIPEFAEGSGTFGADAVTACYCPGLIATLDDAQ